MNIIIVIFLVCSFFSVAYWFIVQPTLMHKLQYNLFATRDRLRGFAIDGKIEKTSIVYQRVESYLCGLIAVGPETSLAAFVYFECLTRNSIDENELRFFDDAPECIKNARYAATIQFLKMMIVNSPVLAAILALTALVLWFRGRITKEKIYRATESYAGSLSKIKGDLPAHYAV